MDATVLAATMPGVVSPTNEHIAVVNAPTVPQDALDPAMRRGFDDSMKHVVAAGVLFATLLSPARIVAEVAPPARPQLSPATSAQILEAVRTSGASAVVVNLWATWCTPCREEFPDLMRFHRAWKDRGVRLLLVSGDFSTDVEAASEFLASQGVDFASYLKAGKDHEFINALDPNWSGALPATFVYDAKGERRHSFLGPVTYESLELEVAPLVDAAAAARNSAKAQRPTGDPS